MNKLDLNLYKNMLLIRLAEEGIAKRYKHGKMRCPTHLSIGQEASASGVGLALRKTDLALSTHRGHAHYLAKGGSLKRMIAEIYGKSTGCSKGKGGSMHLIDRSVGFEGSTAIVGNTIPIGVGLALSLKLDTKNSISIVYCGDGSVEEGVFYESVNFAVTKKLPVLFVCENNLYSVYSPLKVRQPKNRKIYEMVQSMGIEVGYEDGNDVRKVNSLASKAVSHIRDNGSPYFIELSTYRWREHCGPNYDNDIGYRSEDEFLEWKKRDPVKLFKKTLIKEDSRNQKELDKIKNSVQLEVDNAFSFAEKSPFPDSKKAFESMFK
ncbi:MAG: acetoin dehydrogenase [Candidatus Marinimicrobia bacterium]|nr:acetoin dehydrogenase [Candidatus Neomarinimicrobiota bacterium]|tara:strand:- start:1514 stop:2476 length:963 start_codon:yes stop_codon:yes gene_type:complete